MTFFSSFKNSFLTIKNKIQGNTLESLFWIVNVIPNLTGYSIQGEAIWAPYWVIHLTLMFYVYAVGIVDYQWNHADGIIDFIKNYVNISLFTLVLNNSWWWVTQRKLLKSIMKDIVKSDQWSRRSLYFKEKHTKLMRLIKWIILAFYSVNFLNATLVYWPNRMRGRYYLTPCVGLGTVTVSPKREICMLILGVTELCISNVVLNFQALLVLLIAHTAVMYQLLSEEMILLNEKGNDEDIKMIAQNLIPSLVYRHTITMRVVDKLKSLYSVPLGVNFLANAVCISLFFYLPLQEWLIFMPILVYCCAVFFLYCFLGQRLVNASENFERAVYCCGWENFDLKQMKMVYVMLRQAQQPIELLASDIIPVNIATFATTCQGMFKFVTVMKV